jgi:soluble lytic murein transglycosylase-like protein
MKRLIPLLGVVLALALSSTAAADTFRVVHTQSSGTASFATGGSAIPFTASQSGPMSFTALRGIWQAAGATYGIPWEVLAAINKVETNFGQNLGPSSAGAVGWMQFMPSTWARWGIDANGDGVADPNNPTDAIFSAARYLAGCGGQFDIAAAVYCYNHASWYVSDVLSLAAQYSQGGGMGVFAAGPSPAQLAAARAKIDSAKTQLVAALAQARTLAHRERRFARAAGRATLLSDQLESNKHAAQLAVRRGAVETRVARLRGLLRSATAQLNKTQSPVASMPFASTVGGMQVGRIDQGVDYTSSSPYAALASGTVVYIDPNFWQGTPSVYEKLDRPIVVNGHRYDEIYYSETPALVNVGQRLVPGQAVIGPGSAELGFARGNLPAAHGLYHEGDQTAAGQDFYRYMTAGHPGSGSAPAQFYLLSGAFDTAQPGAGGADSFTSNVVYFTH